MSERYVLLGLARTRSPWFADVARWCTTGAVPAQFFKCVSIAETRARLGSGRAFSALLIDHRAGAADRDLIADATARGCAVIVVADPQVPLPDAELGITARLDPDLTRAALLDVLSSHAPLVADTTSVPSGPEVAPAPTPWSGALVAVCGPGGTGTSTIASALAQGFAADPRHSGLVLLADLALHADQAVLHGTDDVMPGVPELIDACRRGTPTPEALQRLTFWVPARRYRLLLGLRRHRDWVALRPASVSAAIDGLTRSFQVVVADVDGDVEGDEQCGVIEIEERNLLARTAAQRADVVAVVGGPGLKGTHALTRQVAALIELGVPADRIVPVVNRAPRRPGPRAAITRTVGTLCPPLATPPIFLPERNGIDEVHRDGAAFPSALCDPIRRAAALVLSRGDTPRSAPEPQRIVPGTLGSWTEPDAAAR